MFARFGDWVREGQIWGSIFRHGIPRDRRTRVYETIERPLVAVLAAMERRGIRVDPAMLRQLSADFGARMAELDGPVFGRRGVDRANVGDEAVSRPIARDVEGLEHRGDDLAERLHRTHMVRKCGAIEAAQIQHSFTGERAHREHE